MSMSADSPQCIAIAVVERCDGDRDAQYLIRQRPPGAPLAGLWEFPGGKVQPGESAEAAAVRECREESGLAIRVIDQLATVDHAYAHGKLRLEFFRCTAVDPSTTPAGGFRWVDRAALGEYEFPPANERVLQMLGLTPSSEPFRRDCGQSKLS